MIIIQLPFEPSLRIPLTKLVELVGHESEVIEQDERLGHDCMDLFNNIVSRVKDLGKGVE
jgi:hypothetical protein